MVNDKVRPAALPTEVMVLEVIEVFHYVPYSRGKKKQKRKRGKEKRVLPHNQNDIRSKIDEVAFCRHEKKRSI